MILQLLISNPTLSAEQIEQNGHNALAMFSKAARRMEAASDLVPAQ
jgi:hypothetical protein